jgi:hypothetical protein
MTMMRCGQASNARADAFPLLDLNWLESGPGPSAGQRLHLWCERKPAAVEAMLLANADV